jgi:hypothetical protein
MTDTPRPEAPGNRPKEGVPHRPILILLTSHWISMAGVALVTFAGISWLFVLPANVSGHVGNPYVGLLIFMAIPVVFFTGLALMPIGIALSRRKVGREFDREADRPTAIRRAAIFFAVMTVVNVIIGSQVSYRAVEHMETTQFCGESCHVMKPEFTAHDFAPHKSVECASCHIVPGAVGWFHAKLAGTAQMAAVVFNTFPRPIESPMENNKLVSSADTCEQCHARDRAIGSRLRVVREFKSDETNSEIDTVLMMNVGGGRTGGIHGAHMAPGVAIRYAAADKKRQTIPWVEYRNTETNVTRVYAAAGAKPEGLPIYQMQCVDCHNRAAHSFETAEHAVDRAIAAGSIPAVLPLVRKTGLDILQTEFKSDGAAQEEIPSRLLAFYAEKYPDVGSAKKAEIQAAGKALAAIYSRNVFPDLKVTWGTYPSNLGHTDAPGCFRCHDDSHATADKKTITQDCSACHQILASEETAPPILKTLGLP